MGNIVTNRRGYNFIQTRCDDGQYITDAYSSGYNTANQSCESTNDTATLNQIKRDNPRLLQHGLSKGDKSSILRFFKYLRDEIQPECIIDLFVADGDLNSNDEEEIRVERTRSSKVDLLIRKMLRFGQSDAFVRFLRYLERDDVGKKYVSEHLTGSHQAPDLMTTHLQEEEMFNILIANRETLLEELEPEEIAVNLLTYGALTVDQYEKVKLKSYTRREKCGVLLSFIEQSLPESYCVLLTALQEVRRKDLVCILTSIPDSDAQGAKPKNRRNIRKVKPQKKTKTILSHQHETSAYRLKIELEIKNKHREKTLVKELNKIDVKYHVNDELIVSTNCLLKETEHGSIVLHIKLIGDALQTGLVAIVSKIIETVIGNPKVATFLPEEELSFDVTLQPDQTQGPCFKRSQKQLICAYKDFLIEELNPFSLCSGLHQCNVLRKQEINDVLHMKSRAAQTRRILDMILQKEDGQIQRFFLLLEDTNATAYLHICPEKISAPRSIAYIANNLDKFYKDLIDNISPDAITDACRGLLNYEEVHSLTMSGTGTRQYRAMVLLQTFLGQGQSTREEFVQILERYNQIPTAILELAEQEKHAATQNREDKTCILENTDEVVLGTFRLKSTKEYQKKPRSFGFFMRLPWGCMLPHVQSEVDSGYGSIPTLKKPD